MALTRHEALQALVKTRDKWPRDMFDAAQYAPDGCPSFDENWWWHWSERSTGGEMILASDDFDIISKDDWIREKKPTKAEIDPNEITKCDLPPVDQWPEYANVAVMHEDGAWIFGTFDDARPVDDPKGWEGIGRGWWYPGPRIVSEPRDRDKWKEAIVYRHPKDKGQVINDTPLGGMEENPFPNEDEIEEMFEAAREADVPRDPGQHYRKTLMVDLTSEDIARGYIDIKLDPYRICALYSVGGGPREQLVKKGLRGESKGQTEQEVIDDIRAILDRWEEMTDENTRMLF